MNPARTSRSAAASIAAVVAMTVMACATTSSSSLAPTAIMVPTMSLIPAVETSTPEPAGTPGELPPVGPPSGVPPPPDVSTGYSGPADDLVAFVAAYRAAFQVTELSDQQIQEAGARLCAYLQGQADDNGVVDAERALADAEINEPGYPRDEWVLAFGIASTSYCGAFTFDLEGQG
jgi:hypothetical protein